jgi:hypothetical protein
VECAALKDFEAQRGSVTVALQAAREQFERRNIACKAID